MIDRFEVLLHRARSFFSRSRISVGLLKLEKSAHEPRAPGLILIQIDGLARAQFEKALAAGRMPFLASLRKREGYRVHDFYSGVPSTTPAVQGELFYGVRQAVPAFAFRSRESGLVERMYFARSATMVQRRLEAEGRGLLEGGCSLSNIYGGGAAEVHFCPAGIDTAKFVRSFNKMALAAVAMAYGWSAVRVVALMVAEFFLAIFDSLRGGFEGEDLRRELKFVPTRVGICIMGREFVAIGAKLAIARGLPVVHANFLGYDEQAHRRGPSSLFAHWALRGIDARIREIWNEARRHSRTVDRDYELWIYSDHGQSKVLSYETEFGRPVHDAVAEVLGRTHRTEAADRAGEQGARKDYVTLARRGRERAEARAEAEAAARRSPDDPARADAELVVCAQGPVGHVYPPEPIPPEEIPAIARGMIERGIPMVLVPDGDDGARVWNERGEFRLPEDAADVLGANHPFLHEAARDFARLTRHPDAGAIVFSGHRPGGPCLSFPVESGSHAGPGPDETHGFALLPPDAPLGPETARRVRPEDLRRAALRELGRPDDAPAPDAEAASRGPTDGIEFPPRDRPAGVLRVATYNVHSCVGMDGRVSIRRVARAIRRLDADVVALQELDVGRGRTDSRDQAMEIANELRMDFHFHPALRVEEELYGDAVLSRLPMRLVKAGALPGPKGREPRGALWVKIEFAGAEIDLIDTHFGLSAAERVAQAKALVGPEWMGSPEFGERAILLGDFNALPGTEAYRVLNRRLPDAQRRHGSSKPTYYGRMPFGRIDHVFASEALRPVRVEVRRDDLTRRASDHLPLAVDFELAAPASPAPTTSGSA